MVICILWPQRLNERNRAKYQRILSLSSHHQVHFFVRGGQEISKEIKDLVFRIKESPHINNLYLSHFVYFIYMVFCLGQLILRSRVDIMYSFVDQTSFISFAVQKIFGKIWVADIIDYPNSELAAVEQDLRNLSRTASQFRLNGRGPRPPQVKRISNWDRSDHTPP